MMRKYFLFFIAIIFMVLTGCASVSLKTDYDKEVDFTKFKTYAWHKGASVPGDVLAKNPLIKKRIPVMF